MKLSTDRILTTHVGSLPRPPDLLSFLEARESGREFEEAAFDACLAVSVEEIVQKQVAAGIDIVCDGELSKISYTFYVRHRLSGIGAFRGGDNDQPPQTAAHRDLLDHPDYQEVLNRARGGTSWFSREAVPCCTGPVAYRNRRPLEVDLANLAAASSAAKPVETFMNAASPGVLTKFVPDRYYQDEDAYVEALANALKEEYEAIAGAGVILQIDAGPGDRLVLLLQRLGQCFDISVQILVVPVRDEFGQHAGRGRVHKGLDRLRRARGD